MKYQSRVVAGFAVAIVLVSSGVVLADASSTITAQGPYQLIEPYLLSLFGVIISAAAAWAATKFHQMTGIAIKDSDRSAVQNAAMNAAGRILAGIEGPVSQIKFDTRSLAVKDETDRVLWLMKDEANRLGLTPEKVSTIITGKLGIAQQGASPAGQSGA